MKVVLSTIGRFHIFPLARELQALGALERIFTGMPWVKVKGEGVERDRVSCYPLLRPAVMGLRFVPFSLPGSIAPWLHLASLETLDRHVRRKLPDADVFVGHEGAGLLSGQAAKDRGMLYVCDRGCTHISFREGVLNEEHERLGLPKRPRTLSLERELAEYEAADAVAVASESARISFVDRGFAPERVGVIPYGVDLSRFHPVARPDPARFDILCVGEMAARKGVKYLIEAFHKLETPGKHLTLVGGIDPTYEALIRPSLEDEAITYIPHQNAAGLRELMSRSHAFVLPSVEDGFGMVTLESMACGCPAIVSTAAGSADMIVEGENGLKVEARDVDGLTQALQSWAEDRDLRDRMGAAALETVKDLGGWEDYGRRMVAFYQDRLSVAGRG